MKCPRCDTEIPGPAGGKASEPGNASKPAKAGTADQPRTPRSDDAVRANAPPAPCPQCGWSVMWNE